MTKWTIPDDLVALLRRPYGNLTGGERHMMARITHLEQHIIEALRARDEDIRDILRKGLHGETE